MLESSRNRRGKRLIAAGSNRKYVITPSGTMISKTSIHLNRRRHPHRANIAGFAGGNTLVAAQRSGLAYSLPRIELLIGKIFSVPHCRLYRWL